MLTIKFQLNRGLRNMSQQGVSVYLSVIILSILLVMALSLMTTLMNQIRMTKRAGDSVVAFFAADTGIEEILYKDKLCRCATLNCCSGLAYCADVINCNLGISAGTSLNVKVGSAIYNATFESGASSVLSTGEYMDNRRAIQVTR